MSNRWRAPLRAGRRRQYPPVEQECGYLGVFLHVYDAGSSLVVVPFDAHKRTEHLGGVFSRLELEDDHLLYDQRQQGRPPCFVRQRYGVLLGGFMLVVAEQ